MAPYQPSADTAQPSQQYEQQPVAQQAQQQTADKRQSAGQQAQTQAVLDAQRQAAQMAIDEPRQALARFGQGIAGITPGAGSIRIGEAPAAAGASPLMKALGLGLAGADIYGRIFT